MSNFETKLSELTQEQMVLLVEGYIKDLSRRTITPREVLFFELEPFLRQFNEYRIRDPRDGRSEFGYTGNYILTTAKAAGKKYRASLFAWLSYYYRERATQFAELVLAETGVLLWHYDGHPDLSPPCSLNAKKLYNKKKEALAKQKEPTSANNQEVLKGLPPKISAKEDDTVINVVYNEGASNLRVTLIGKFDESIPIANLESQFKFPPFRKRVWNSYAYYNAEGVQYQEIHSKENPLKLENCYNDIFALAHKPALDPIEISPSEDNKIIDKNGTVIGQIEELENDIKSDCFFLNNQSVMATVFYDRYQSEWDNGRHGGYIILHKRKGSSENASNSIASWLPFSSVRIRDHLDEKIMFCPCHEDKAVLAVTCSDIIIMDATKKAILWKETFGYNGIYKACLSSNQSLLAISCKSSGKEHDLDLSGSNNILIFDLKSRECIAGLATSEGVSKQHFYFSALSETQNILMYSSGKGFVFYDYIEKKFLFPSVVGDLPAFTTMMPSRSYLQFSSDGQYFRLGNSDHQWVYEIKRC